MKQSAILLCLCITLISCSTYNVNTEIEKGSSLDKIKKIGLIIRTRKHARPSRKLLQQSLSYWLEGHQNTKKIEIVPPTESIIDTFDNTYDRLSQRSINDRFLRYKTMGVIKLYIRQNREELEKLIKDNNYSGLLIYEIQSSYSGEMQYGEFESMALVLTDTMDIAYLDQQKNSYDIDNSDEKNVEKHLLDRISERLIGTLADIDLIKK